MKTIIKILIPTIIVILITLCIKLFYNNSVEIKFIEETNFETIHDILSQEQFKNKCVLVDLWFASCGPCIKEFQYLPQIKEQFKNLPVEYLYLSSDKGPLRTLYWKKRIKENNLTGYHMCLQGDLLVSVWDTIHNNTIIYGQRGRPYPKNAQVYPHYFIVNKQGEIVDYNAPNPSETDSLITKIKLAI